MARAALLAEVRNGLLELPPFVAASPTIDAFEAFLEHEVGRHPPARARYIEAQLRPLEDRLDAEWRRVKQKTRRAAGELKMQAKRERRQLRDELRSEAKPKSSRTTSSAALSQRSPLNDGWHSSPEPCRPLDELDLVHPGRVTPSGLARSSGRL